MDYRLDDDSLRYEGVNPDDERASERADFENQCQAEEDGLRAELRSNQERLAAAVKARGLTRGAFQLSEIAVLVVEESGTCRVVSVLPAPLARGCSDYTVADAVEECLYRLSDEGSTS